jgi:hypothetical protein
MEISFIGKITACKRLVIDGLVEAIRRRQDRLLQGEG